MKFKNIILSKKKRKPLIIMSAVIFFTLLLVIFNKALLSLVFSIMLLVLGCLSSQFTRATGNINFGIEFIPFATIMFFYCHGLGYGLLAAILMMSISSLLMGNIQIDLFVSLGIFLAVGILAFFIPVGTFGIAMAGIILMIVFNILSIISLTVIGFDIVKNIIYFFGSILFNFILFKYFSEIIFKVLAS